jgi:hypothetical protein
MPWESRLVVYDENQNWHDLGEGPWKNSGSAMQFTEAEVGVPWIVVDGSSRPVAYGDCANVVWSRLRSRQCSVHGTPSKFFFL